MAEWKPLPLFRCDCTKQTNIQSNTKTLANRLRVKGNLAFERTARNCKQKVLSLFYFASVDCPLCLRLTSTEVIELILVVWYKSLPERGQPVGSESPGWTLRGHSQNPPPCCGAMHPCVCPDECPLGSRLRAGGVRRRGGRAAIVPTGSSTESWQSFIVI